MPSLNIDQFPSPPKVGDKVKVMGKVENIDEQNGTVDVSYDEVSFVNKKKSPSDNSSNNTSNDTMSMDQQNNPDTQSLDYALSQSFNKTQ